MYFIKHFLPGIVLAAAFIVIFMILRARNRENTAYKHALGLALAAVFLLFWMNGAVGIIGDANDDANMMYHGVLAVGITGAIISRFQPIGMARTLFAAALVLAGVTIIALIGGLGSTGPIWPWDILIANGIFAALFIGSAWLFLKAAGEHQAADGG
jgi:hypothetical protein